MGVVRSLASYELSAGAIQDVCLIAAQIIFYASIFLCLLDEPTPDPQNFASLAAE
jgi:hypothetical protein